jgi:SsrA-binding protein
MPENIYIKNRSATFDYTIEDKLKAGIVLTGSEIKSVRNGKVSFNDSYCFFSSLGELWIKNMHIAEYVNAGYMSHLPVHDRKLLLQRKELNKWINKTSEKGFTIVPLSMYIDENGRAKLDIGLGRGKKVHDKRETIKTRDVEREIRRILK